MLNSNIRKQVLSGWLKEHHPEAFFSSLKLQQFLFFYEALSRVDQDKADFSFLRGYRHGPVFRDVYGDYTYRTNEFVDSIELMYQEHHVNHERAQFVGFLVSVLNESDLAEITHELSICESDIGDGQVDLDDHDREFLGELRRLYPPDYIASVFVIHVGTKNFVMRQQDLKKLTDDSSQVFLSLAHEDSLQNPIDVSVSDDGVVLID